MCKQPLCADFSARSTQGSHTIPKHLGMKGLKTHRVHYMQRFSAISPRLPGPMLPTSPGRMRTFSWPEPQRKRAESGHPANFSQ